MGFVVEFFCGNLSFRRATEDKQRWTLKVMNRGILQDEVLGDNEDLPR